MYWDLRDFPGDPVQEVITHDFEEIVNDEEVQIVVEVMGGIEPAYTFVKRSLLAGKNVAHRIRHWWQSMAQS